MLCWVFIAVWGLFSRYSEWGLLTSCSARASQGSGLSSGGAPALGYTDFSSCSSGVKSTGSVVWLMGLVVLQHVGSSWTRDQACIFCVGRQILHHWATGGSPLKNNFWWQFTMWFLAYNLEGVQRMKSHFYKQNSFPVNWFLTLIALSANICK